MPCTLGAWKAPGFELRQIAHIKVHALLEYTAVDDLPPVRRNRQRIRASALVEALVSRQHQCRAQERRRGLRIVAKPWGQHHCCQCERANRRNSSDEIDATRVRGAWRRRAGWRTASQGVFEL